MQTPTYSQDLPLPFFKLDKNFAVVESSVSAVELFGRVTSIIEVIEEGSLNKVKKALIKTKENTTIEAVMITPEMELVLSDLFISWTSELHINLIVIQKQEAYSRVSLKLEKLQTRLQETNFELLEEKEKLQEVVEQNHRLSASYIELSKKTALVPIFGDITEEKMAAIDKNIAEHAYESMRDYILFDFTGVGAIEGQGIKHLERLFKALRYMGSEVVIVGLKPNQVQQLHALNLRSEAVFVQSLEQAVKKYM